MLAVLTVELVGAAFESDSTGELARILQDAAGKINSLASEPGWQLVLFDSNGNRVGKLRIIDGAPKIHDGYDASNGAFGRSNY